MEFENVEIDFDGILRILINILTSYKKLYDAI